MGIKQVTLIRDRELKTEAIQTESEEHVLGMQSGSEHPVTIPGLQGCRPMLRQYSPPSNRILVTLPGFGSVWEGTKPEGLA